MARNRRRRSETSMKCAIGRGCLLLFAGVTCVAFSITKIIIGSEYVSACPSREMIPIFVIVSGCLPVLLSALRKPYNGGDKMDEDRWSMKMSLITALLGVMINLAWLVAGTYLVVTTWSGKTCTNITNASNDTNTTVYTMHLNNSGNPAKDDSAKRENTPENSLTQMCSHTDTSDLFRNISRSTETPSIMIVGHGTTRAFKNKSDTKQNEVMTEEETTENVTSALLSGVSKSVDKSCITCDQTILSFSLAVIIVDWLFVIFGALYFCYFVYYRFSSLKDQLLLINA